MKFQKKLLAFAITSALAVPAAANFNLEDVDVDKNGSIADPAEKQSTATIFASEIDVTSGNFTLDPIRASAPRGITGTTNTILYVLDKGASFANSPSLTPTCSNTATTPYTSSSDASCAKAYSAVRVGKDSTNPNNQLDVVDQGLAFTIDTSGFQNNAAIVNSEAGNMTDTLTLGAPQLKLTSSDDVTLTFRLYDDKSDAEIYSNNNILGSTVQRPVISFGPVINNGNAGAPETVKIDVAQESKKLESSTLTAAPLCSFNISFDTIPKLLDGTLAAGGLNGATTHILSTDNATDGDGSRLIVEGDFSAAKDTNGKADPTKVFLSKSTLCNDTVSGASSGIETVISDDFKTVTFFLGNKSPSGLLSATKADETGYICYKPDGNTVLVEQKGGNDGTLKATYQPVSIDTKKYSVTNMALNCGGLEKGGSSYEVPMILDPDSKFKQWIRVTNPSNTDGVVRITAYNDKGEPGTQQMEFMLPAHNSTGLFGTDTIVKETGVTVGTTANDGVATANGTVGGLANKIRLVVDAEFGSTGSPTGVVVRTLATSSDRTVFSQFD